MAEIITGLTSQPEFPAEDLVEVNERFLAVMLADKLWIEENHAFTEELVPAFRATHPAVYSAATRETEGARLAAVEHGMMVFESMTANLSATKIILVNGTIAQIAAKDLLSRGAVESLKQSEDEFRTSMPRAARVVHEASLRFFGEYSHYSVAGAGLERMITLRALDDQMTSPAYVDIAPALGSPEWYS